MVLDPKKHADWEIAQDAETRMKTVQQLGRGKIHVFIPLHFCFLFTPCLFVPSQSDISWHYFSPFSSRSSCSIFSFASSYEIN